MQKREKTKLMSHISICFKQHNSITNDSNSNNLLPKCWEIWKLHFITMKLTEKISPANYYPFHIQTFFMWAILIVLTIASECMQVNSTIPTSQMSCIWLIVVLITPKKRQKRHLCVTFQSRCWAVSNPIQQCILVVLTGKDSALNCLASFQYHQHFHIPYICHFFYTGKIFGE